MGNIIALIAEGKILEAMEKGEFDNLEGRGKPLNLDDWSHVPYHLRVAYKILKNAGYVPGEVTLQKEIADLCASLIRCTSSDEKQRLRKELADKTMEFNMIMERRNRR